MNTDKKNFFSLDMLKKTISINSVSGNENELANYIFEVLKELGVDTAERQFLDDGRFNVLGTVKGALLGPKILLTGHLDTVPAGSGWNTDPFSPVVDGDFLYGRGALDMKGGIAVILSIMKTALERKEKLRGEIIAAFVPDEEAYSAGAKKLVESGLSADFGLAPEPDPEAVIGAVGKMLIKATVKGVASHGSQPEKGINAVEEASAFIAKMNSEIGKASHSRLNAQPFVTLKIEGGFKEYGVVVPEFCEFIINKHTVPAETKDLILAKLTALSQQPDFKAKFEFEVVEPYYESYDLAEDLIWLEKLKDVYRKVTGRNLRFAYGTGVSDNNVLAPGLGISVVSLGPEGRGLHASNECVKLSSLYEIDDIYHSFIFGED